MQRNISRREFGKRLAGGATLLALQPAWNYPAAGQSLRNDLKDISGELSFDDAVLQAAADDFGRVVHKKPAAVLESADEELWPPHAGSAPVATSKTAITRRRDRTRKP